MQIESDYIEGGPISRFTPPDLKERLQPASLRLKCVFKYLIYHKISLEPGAWMTRPGHHTLTMKSSDYLQAICPPHRRVGPGLGEAAQGEVGAQRQADVWGRGGDRRLHARLQLYFVEELPRPKVRP